MTLQIRRTATPNAPPPNGSLAPGQLAVEMASTAPRLWVGTDPALAYAGNRRLVIDSGGFLPLSGGTIAGDLTVNGQTNFGTQGTIDGNTGIAYFNGVQSWGDVRVFDLANPTTENLSIDATSGYIDSKGGAGFTGTVSANYAPNGLAFWGEGLPGINPTVGVTCYANNLRRQPEFFGFTNRGVAASPLPPATGDPLVLMGGFGYSGGTGSSYAPYNEGGIIEFLAAENWSSTACGTSVVITTARIGTTTQAESLRVHADGNLTIAGATLRLSNAQAGDCLLQMFDSDGSYWGLESYNTSFGILHSLSPASGFWLMTPGPNLWIDGNITAGGNITGANFPSDRRLKKNIGDYNTRGLEAVRALNPISWQWNGQAGMPDDGKTHYGLLADDLLETIPEAVEEIERRHPMEQFEAMTVKIVDDKSVLCAVINAIKELDARLKELAGKVDELERDRK